jgi:hypothetical protein
MSTELPDNRQRGSLGGTVLRGPDGSMYFVRDEMLEALKVEGEGLERLEEVLQQKSSKVDLFPAETKPAKTIRPTAYVRGSLLREDSRNLVAKLPDKGKIAASTIMCPWFC